MRRATPQGGGEQLNDFRRTLALSRQCRVFRPFFNRRRLAALPGRLPGPPWGIKMPLPRAPSLRNALARLLSTDPNPFQASRLHSCPASLPSPIDRLEIAAACRQAKREA